MQHKENYKLALLSVILAAVSGGGIAVFSKLGLKDIPPLTFTFLRFLIASLCLVPFIIKEKPTISSQTWKVALISLLATLNVALFAFGVRLTIATVGQVLYAFVPLVAALLSYVLLKESITLKKLVGIGVGFFGVMIIILLPVIDKSSSLQGNFLGNIIIFLGVLSFSTYSVLCKKISLDYSPIVLTFVFAVTTTIVMAFFAVYEFMENPDWVNNISTVTIFSTLYVGLLGGTVYYLLYQYAIKHGTPLIASMTLFLQPVATFLWAFALLGEKLTLGIAVGASLALLGAYIVTIQRRT